MKKTGRIISACKSIVSLMKEKRITTFAAAADYHMLIALPPAVMLMISLVRFLPVTQEELLQFFSDTVPDQVYSVLESVVSSIFESSQTTTIITFFLLLFSASGAMRSLMKGICHVYGSERRESFVIFAARAVIYTLLLLLMIILSLFLLVYGSQLLDYLSGTVPEQSFLQALITVLRKIRYVLLPLVLTVIFMFLYRCLPAQKPKFRTQFPGALFCAVAWSVFSFGYSVYVSVSGRFGAYGYLGTVMVIMMWMYYCLLFFLLGGCINVYRASVSGHGASE